MSTMREPAVAGLFYPAEPAVLGRMVDSCMNARGDATAPPSPLLVVPHAGLPFSGPIAATAYATVEGTPVPRRVVLLGPSHRVPLDGLALSSASHFRTPLGDLPVDYPALPERVGGPVRLLDAAHAAEHCLEVQLPFVQRLWGNDVAIAPIVVGETDALALGDLVADLLQEPGALVLISTDLSHYHDYPTARRIDADTVERIEQLRGAISPAQACGCRPLNGVMEYCRASGHRLRALDVRNSGDTAGGRERVVGYGAFTLQ